MQKTSHLAVNRQLRACLAMILLSLVALGSSTLHANPYGSYGYSGGHGYYQPQCHGWSGGCNRGGWLGTGVPNGLGWTLFGLSAAAAISTPCYAAPAPVVVEQPVYVQQHVVIQSPSVTQAPLVNYNGVPCYYINGNYYRAYAAQ